MGAFRSKCVAHTADNIKDTGSNLPNPRAVGIDYEKINHAFAISTAASNYERRGWKGGNGSNHCSLYVDEYGWSGSEWIYNGGCYHTDGVDKDQFLSLWYHVVREYESYASQLRMQCGTQTDRTLIIDYTALYDSGLQDGIQSAWVITQWGDDTKGKGVGELVCLSDDAELWGKCSTRVCGDDNSKDDSNNVVLGKCENRPAPPAAGSQVGLLRGTADE